MRAVIGLAIAVVAGGCLFGNGGTGAAGTSDGGGASGQGGGGGGEQAPEGVPSEPSALLEFLETERYRKYQNGGVELPFGPHGLTGLRIYLDPQLAQSLQDGNAEHPVGSAAIAELLGSGASDRLGWVVSLKVSPQGDVGTGWLWLEAEDTAAGAVAVEQGVGLGTCVSCHAAGVDSVLSGTF